MIMEKLSVQQPTCVRLFLAKFHRDKCNVTEIQNFDLLTNLNTAGCPAGNPASSKLLCNYAHAAETYALKINIGLTVLKARDTKILQFCTHRILHRIGQPVQSHQMSQKLKNFADFLATFLPSLHLQHLYTDGGQPAIIL